MGDILSVTLTNQLAEIERLAGMVEEFAQRHGLPTKALFDINLSLDELLTNIMSYAYDDSRPHDILVTMAVEQGDVAIALEDDGRAHDPFTAPAPELDLALEDRAIGGLGVHFVRNLMDAFEYRREGNRNIVLLKKQIST
jgi:sigma-B regulation protein RsbU (phosphoserine phosphatase)